MSSRRHLRPLLRGLLACALLVGAVWGVRRYCVESYRISTDAMEEALSAGDYIVVGKWRSALRTPRNKVVLFTSPLERDTACPPLFVSRCVGLPGDTIRVTSDGYEVNGLSIPRSPRSLSAYFVALSAKEPLLHAMERLKIPVRDLRQERFGYMLSLTGFEEYQLREELPAEVSRQLIGERTTAYRLLVPRAGRAYPIDSTSLTACKEIIRRETAGKALFRDGKLYLDGRETNFFFFQQDYYWMLSDNTNEAIDSRHLGFIPADHLVGKALFCWYSPDKRKIFKTVH